MYTYYFEKLEVWQLSRKFAVEVYKLTSQFPDSEKYGLVSQIRRASISISSNIAEGISRESNKDKSRFLVISYASTIEVLNQLIISNDLGFITTDDLNMLRLRIEEITNKINAFKKALNR